MRTLSELDWARSVRSASATVGPSAESPAGDAEVGDDYGLLRTEGALAAQRRRRPNAESAGDHEPHHQHGESTDRQAAADPGSAPGEVGTRLERECGQGSLRGHATARRALRRDGVRPIRGALHVGGQPDDRQAREHHAQRAREHPVGEAHDFGRGPGRYANQRRRRRPEAERLAEGKPAAVEDRRNRIRVSAGGDGLQDADQLACLLRAAIRVLCQARHDQLGQGGRHIGTDGPDVARRLRHVRRQQPRRGAALERRPPGDQLVRHHPERIEIHPVIGVRVRRRLLGRHVDRRPDGGSYLR